MNNEEKLRALMEKWREDMLIAQEDETVVYSWVVFKQCVVELAQALSASDGVAEGFVVVPRELTAENGAKAALIGEFSEREYLDCPDCGEDPDNCETCSGSGAVAHEVAVSWDNIKRIHARVVELFAAPAAPTPKCTRCDAQSAEACDGRGCGYLSAGNGAPAAPVAPEHSHGGRPMTLREIMEAEEEAAPAVEFVKEPLRNVPDGASFVEYMEQLAVGNLTAVDQIALDNLLYGRLKDTPAVEVDEAMASGEFKRNDRVTVRFLSGAVHSGTVTLRHGISYDVFLDNGVGVQVGAAQVAALGREGGGNGL